MIKAYKVGIYVKLLMWLSMRVDQHTSTLVDALIGSPLSSQVAVGSGKPLNGTVILRGDPAFAVTSFKPRRSIAGATVKIPCKSFNQES